MNTNLGYSKRTLTDTDVLLSGGGNKPLSDFIGSISWDATNKKITYTPIGGTATDLVTLIQGDNITFTNDATNKTITIAGTANTWKAANTAQEGYIPKLVTGGGTIATQASEYVLTYVSSGSGTVTPTWKLLPANAFSNTWKAANTSLEGYVPKLALASTNTITTLNTEYVLTYIAGTETAPVWRKLPANAFSNTWNAWSGATDSANGTAGYMPAPTSALRYQFLRGDGQWVSLNNYSLPKSTTSALGGIIISNALTTAVTLTSANGSTASRYYGVQIDKDGKAFVNIPWTDAKATQTDNNDDSERPILLKNGTGTGAVTNGVLFVDGITINPSTDSLTIGGNLSVTGSTTLSSLNISISNLGIINKLWNDSTLYNNGNTAILATSAAIRNAIRFLWYNTYWNIGNVRGDSTNTAGFGIALEDTTNNRLIDCFRVTSTAAYIAGNEVLHTGNLSDKSVGAASVSGITGMLNINGSSTPGVSSSYTLNLTFHLTNAAYQGNNNGWCNYIICSHNGVNYWNYVIGLPFEGTPIYSRTVDGVALSWCLFITSENIATYISAAITFTKTITVTSNWLSTGITYGDITESGTYIVQMKLGNHIFSGVMSWYAGIGGTNDEISLHYSGPGNPTRLYLLTYNGLLLIVADEAISSASYVFNFKKIL